TRPPAARLESIARRLTFIMTGGAWVRMVIVRVPWRRRGVRGDEAMPTLEGVTGVAQLDAPGRLSAHMLHHNASEPPDSDIDLINVQTIYPTSRVSKLWRGMDRGCSPQEELPQLLPSAQPDRQVQTGQSVWRARQDIRPRPCCVLMSKVV